MLDCGFAEFLYRGVSLSIKVQCLPQIEECLGLAGSHVVAQTQDVIWYEFGVAWFNSRRWGCFKD